MKPIQLVLPDGTIRIFKSEKERDEFLKEYEENDVIYEVNNDIIKD